MNKTPVITAGAIVALIEAGLIMAVSLGWLDLNNNQMAAIMAFVASFVAVIAPLVGALLANKHVTPLIDPRDVDGEPLTRSDNSPALRARDPGW